MEPDVLDAPFLTVPALAPADEERITRRLAQNAPDWRKLGNLAGVHPSDMKRFLKGEASLTESNRKRIRQAIKAQREQQVEASV